MFLQNLAGSGTELQCPCRDSLSEAWVAKNEVFEHVRIKQTKSKKCPRRDMNIRYKATA